VVDKGTFDQGVSNAEFQSGLTYDESVIVVLQLTEPAVCRIRSHQGAECPLIDRASAGVWLEECRGNEGLQHKPSANIDTIMNERRDSAENTMRSH